MHFVIVILLVGGGSWVWRHANSPSQKLLAGLCVGLGVLALLGLAMFYRGLHRDQRK